MWYIMKKHFCPHCGKKSISTFNKITPGLYGPPIRGFVKSGSECPNCGGRFFSQPSKTKLSKFIFYTITFPPYIYSIGLILFSSKLRIFAIMGLTAYFFLYILLILPIYNFFSHQSRLLMSMVILLVKMQM